MLRLTLKLNATALDTGRVCEHVASNVKSTLSVSAVDCYTASGAAAAGGDGGGYRRLRGASDELLAVVTVRGYPTESAAGAAFVALLTSDDQDAATTFLRKHVHPACLGLEGLEWVPSDKEPAKSEQEESEDDGDDGGDDSALLVAGVVVATIAFVVVGAVGAVWALQPEGWTPGCLQGVKDTPPEQALLNSGINTNPKNSMNAPAGRVRYASQPISLAARPGVALGRAVSSRDAKEAENARRLRAIFGASV